jgi:hypothetical protein
LLDRQIDLIDVFIRCGRLLAVTRDLLRRQGHLFVNPPRMIYDVLTTSEEICEARRRRDEAA